MGERREMWKIIATVEEMSAEVLCMEVQLEKTMMYQIDLEYKVRGSERGEGQYLINRGTYKAMNHNNQNHPPIQQKLQ